MPDLPGQVNQILRGKILSCGPLPFLLTSNEIPEISRIDQEALTNFDEWNLSGP